MAKYLVTGAGGVLGQALVAKLKSMNADFVAITRRNDCNLENSLETAQFFADHKPTHVYHLAGAVYGVGGNLAFGGDIFRRNTLINCNVVEAARQCGAARVLGMGTVAMYADGIAMPLKEADVLVGQPHHSEKYYAFAKRGMLIQLESYKAQYGLDYVLALSTNLYGPGDRFDEVNGHVVPSLIKKFVDGEELNKVVKIWGDGSPTRDILFSRDAAAGLVLLMEAESGVYNLATAKTVTIRNLVETISNFFPSVAYEWDVDKPLGQLRRDYDVGKLYALGFMPKTDLRDGIHETIEWYKSHRDIIRS